jgi:hypothetical protein
MINLWANVILLGCNINTSGIYLGKNVNRLALRALNAGNAER